MPFKKVETQVADIPDETVEARVDDEAVATEVVAKRKNYKLSDFKCLFSFKLTWFLCCCCRSSYK